MYMFYVDVFGDVPMGNDGEMILRKRLSDTKLRKLAEDWLHGRRGSVYVMNEWTQQMCELGPRRFSMYIQEHGKLVARH